MPKSKLSPFHNKSELGKVIPTLFGIAVSISNRQTSLLVLICLSLSLLSALSEILVIGTTGIAVSSLFSNRGLSTLSGVVQNAIGRSISLHNTLLIVIGIICLSGLLRYSSLRLNNILAAEFSSLLARKTYHNVANLDCKRVNEGKSSYLNLLTQEMIFLSGGVIQPAVAALNSFMSILIISALMIYNIEAGIVAISLLLAILLYIVVALLSRNKSTALSKVMASSREKILDNCKQLIDGIEIIKVYRLNNKMCDMYMNYQALLNNKIAEANTVNATPRYMIETLLLVAVLVMLFSVNDTKNIAITLPILFVSILKLVPHLQALFQSYSSIKNNQSSIYKVKTVLESLPEHELKSSFEHIGTLLPNTINNEFNFAIHAFEDDQTLLRLENLSYKLPRENALLFIKELTIYQGEMVAIVGPSGIGKTTLLNLIVGLDYPDSGKILASPKLFESINTEHSRFPVPISYANQTPLIFTGSIEDNVCSLKPLDSHPLRLKTAIKASCLDSFRDLNAFVDQKTISGGQAQRLSLSRALYQQSRLILLDEITNGLDSATKSSLLANLKSLHWKPALICISHDRDLVDSADRIIDMKSFVS